MPITIAVLSTTVSVLNGTFTLGNNFYQLHAAKRDWAEAIEFLASLQRDLKIARDLRDRNFPDKSSPETAENETFLKAQESIRSLSDAVRQCEKLLQEEKEPNGAVTGIANRFKWVLGGKTEFSGKLLFLSMHHGRLLSVITDLKALPEAKAVPAPPSYESAVIGNIGQYLSPEQRRIQRGQSLELPDDEADEERARDAHESQGHELQSKSAAPSTTQRSPKKSRKNKDAFEPPTLVGNSGAGELMPLEDNVDEALMRALKRRRRHS